VTKKPVAGPQPASGRAWVPAFATRLCLIAWCTAVLTEILPRSGLESLCLLVGTQAAGLGILTCLIVGIRFRQAILLLLLVALSPPAIYFYLVLARLSRQGS
jgi:hypothetical protein